MSALENQRHRLVRAIARENSPAAEELFTVAAGQKKDWTLEEWNDLLRSLDVCEDKVDDWLALRE